jgi:hypothetical protein
VRVSSLAHENPSLEQGEQGRQGEHQAVRASSLAEYHPKPKTQNPLPITHYLLPITYYLLPITHYPKPITHYPLPITHYLLPITQNPLPITDLRGLGRLTQIKIREIREILLNP